MLSQPKADLMVDFDVVLFHLYKFMLHIVYFFYSVGITHGV